jgi:hypothetical protein
VGEGWFVNSNGTTICFETKSFLRPNDGRIVSLKRALVLLLRKVSLEPMRPVVVVVVGVVFSETRAPYGPRDVVRAWFSDARAKGSGKLWPGRPIGRDNRQPATRSALCALKDRVNDGRARSRYQIILLLGGAMTEMCQRSFDRCRFVCA